MNESRATRWPLLSEWFVDLDQLLDSGTVYPEMLDYMEDIQRRGEATGARVTSWFFPGKDTRSVRAWASQRRALAEIYTDVESIFVHVAQYPEDRPTVDHQSPSNPKWVDGLPEELGEEWG